MVPCLSFCVVEKSFDFRLTPFVTGAFCWSLGAQVTNGENEPYD